MKIVLYYNRELHTFFGVKKLKTILTPDKEVFYVIEFIDSKQKPVTFKKFFTSIAVVERMD